MICRDIFLWVSFDVNLLCDIVFSVKKVNCFLQEKNYLFPAVILSRKSAKANADFFR